MLGGFEHIRREWHAVKGAPGSFIIVLLVGLTAGWGSAYLLFSERIAALDARNAATIERLNFKDEQVQDVRRKLDERERSALKDELSGKSGRVTIGTPSPQDPLAQDLK